MNEKLNQKAIEKKDEPKARVEVKRHQLTPVKTDELRHIEGGGCALMKIPPYWRCW
jgi:hypothetical protein